MSEEYWKDRAQRAETEIENWRSCYETRKSEIKGLKEKLERTEAENARRRYTIEQKDDVIGNLKSSLPSVKDERLQRVLAALDRAAEWSDFDYDIEGGNRSGDLGLVRQYLSTSPNESETCGVCGMRIEDLKWCDGPFDWCPPRNAPHTPDPIETDEHQRIHDTLRAVWHNDIDVDQGLKEIKRIIEPQQTGDALAAYQATIDEAPNVRRGVSLDEWCWREDRIVRDALTTSGVPYVPENRDE